MGESFAWPAQAKGSLFASGGAPIEKVLQDSMAAPKEFDSASLYPALAETFYP